MIEWGEAKTFSRLDLSQGYYQIAITEDSINKTAFCIHLRQSEYVVTPFELCNAPSKFQILINKVLATEINYSILIYLDDILVFSLSIGEHWDHLGIALERLRQISYMDTCTSVNSLRTR